MKKKIAFILAVILVICIAVSAMAYTTMYVYTANGKSLNLRDAPNLAGSIMARIPNGAAVIVNGAFDYTWYSVTYGGYTGYAMARYLVSGVPVPTLQPTCVPLPTPTPSYPFPYPTQQPAAFPNQIFVGFEPVVYTALVRPNNPAGYANMRWAPSLEADVHARYYANSILTVMSENSQWCQVLDENGNMMGYMMSQFLQPYYGDS